VLDETVQKEGQKIELYPVKINPFQSIVQKHAHFLFGQVEQSDRPLVSPRILPNSPGEKDVALHAEEVVNRVWWESSGRAIQWVNGALSQIYGGSVFKVAWEPSDALRSIPIRIEAPHPRYFVGRPDAADWTRLREAWIVKPISREEAAENGWQSEGNNTSPPWLVEHWTQSRYEAQINGQPVKRFTKSGEWIEVSGANEWGFVPVVYIPHVRVTGFYGENVIDTIKGIVKELNLRVADFGDAVTSDAHAYVGMRNIQGSPNVQQIAPGLFGVNVGSNPNITGSEADPDIWEIRKAVASDAMEKNVDMLYSLMRRLAFIPAVADGEDEGSQRSGLTLALRMLPLTGHVEIERIFWTAGLDLINRMVLKMLSIKGANGITMRHAVQRVKEEWAPILPRDREIIVQEVASLMTAKLGSPERLLEILGVDNIPEEKKLILDFWKALMEMEAKITAANAPKGSTGTVPKKETSQ
jgi:hypothetical protein